MNGLDDLHLSFRDWCCDSLPRPWGSTSGLCCVLANGQSSCEGSQAPHGSDRRFLRDECQSFSSHGVWGNLDLHLSLPIPLGLGVIGGVGSLSTGSPSGRGSGYLGLMYSQAPVRSYTKDRAGVQGDHTPKGGGYKVKNRNSHVGTSAGHIGPRLWLTTACRSFVVERVPPQGAPQEGAQRYQA